MLLFFLLLPLFNDKDKYNTTFFLLKVKRLIDAPHHRRRAGQRVQRAHTRTREEINNTASAAGRGGGRSGGLNIVVTVQQAKRNKRAGSGTDSPLAHGKTNGCGGEEEEGGEKNEQQTAGATKTGTAVHGSNPEPKKKKKKIIPGQRQRTAAATAQYWPRKAFHLTRYSVYLCLPHSTRETTTSSAYQCSYHNQC